MKFQAGDLIVNEIGNYFFILEVKDKSYMLYWINSDEDHPIMKYSQSAIQNLCTLVTSIFRGY